MGHTLNKGHSLKGHTLGLALALGLGLASLTAGTASAQPDHDVVGVVSAIVNDGGSAVYEDVGVGVVADAVNLACGEEVMTGGDIVERGKAEAFPWFGVCPNGLGGWKIMAGSK